MSNLMHRGALTAILYRTNTELKWAELRLIALGFVLDNEGRVISCTRQHADYVVQADPRDKKCTTFALFPQHQATEATKPLATYEILDHWTNSLKQKYEA